MADASTNFDEVFKSEIAAINDRRASLGREKITPSGQGEQREVIDAVGLALSGGGIRSAAFCLGALQGLDRAKLIDRFDYLSTVSGGGYIGSSLVAAMNVPKDTRTAATALKAEFPFESTLDLSETPSVQHLRDYSNYLFPHFVPDLLKGAAIYLRGLATNVVLVAPWMLLFAAISAILNQHLASWARSNYEGLWYNWFGLQHFVITSLAASALFVLLIVWALVRSTKAFVGLSDIRLFAGWFGAGIVLLLLIAILELQPIVLEWMIVAEEQHRPVFAVDGGWLDRVPQVLAVLSTLVGLFSRYLAQVIGGATEQSGTGRKIAGALSIAMVWAAAAAVPFLIWVGYIYLTFWALHRPQKSIEFFAPDWVQHYAISLFGGQFWAVAGLYILVAIVLIVISCFLNPNANSLHRLYRDRLSKAFLFKPNEIDPTTKELLPQDGLRLSKIKTPLTPYPLINTAINLQASKTANRRGRNADFFVLSPRYVGSEATGYCSTNVMEELTKDLDLGTALAISGAAASSNMGANSIKILAPTLALLNIRLGYWLRNPMYAGGPRASKLLDRIDLYFLFEMFGFLGERSRLVYLTDGGHIENLGMYELLKRKCRIIVTVDAEADPAMNFRSFSILQRYARIDLGVRINLPWQDIREVTRTTDAAMAADKQPASTNGPHCAIGTIDYPKGQKGYLIYMKSSLSGDENDYILNYKRRYPSFPHETTLDQLFSEEQFECYRALGFHATLGVFGDRKKGSPTDRKQDKVTKICSDSTEEMKKEIERVLGVTLQLVDASLPKPKEGEAAKKDVDARTKSGHDDTQFWL